MVSTGWWPLWLPLNAFWGSEANRTARLRPIPDEQPVINTTFASMVLTDQLKRREVQEKRAAFSLCFHGWLQGQLHVNIFSLSATCSPPIISTFHHCVFSFCLAQTWESLLPPHKQKQSQSLAEGTTSCFSPKLASFWTTIICTLSVDHTQRGIFN